MVEPSFKMFWAEDLPSLKDTSGPEVQSGNERDGRDLHGVASHITTCSWMFATIFLHEGD